MFFKLALHFFHFAIFVARFYFITLKYDPNLSKKTNKNAPNLKHLNISAMAQVILLGWIVHFY